MTIPQWAKVVVPHLVAQAKACETITYGELGKKVGYPAFFLGRVLGHIRDEWCRPAGIPEINVLVMSKEDRQPGKSFLAGGTTHLTLAQRRMEFETRKQQVCAYKHWDEFLQRHG